MAIKKYLKNIKDNHKIFSIKSSIQLKIEKKDISHMVTADKQAFKVPDTGIMIREANDRDVEEMFRIEKNCFDMEAFHKYQIYYLVKLSQSISLTAFYNNEMAGFIIGLTNNNRFGKYGRIYTLDVDPKSRNHGVGTILVSELLGRMKEDGCVKCFLEVREDNEKAITLYEKLGFKQKRIIPDYYAKGINGIKMKKDL